MTTKPLKALLLLTFFICLGLQSFAQPKWLNRIKSLKILVSTQKDVEKKFGSPVAVYENIKDYKIKEGEVTVTYAARDCIENGKNGWNVEDWTVLEIAFSPNDNRRFKFSSLRLDLSKYRQIPSIDVENVTYKNDEEGISFNVIKDLIVFVIIYPPKKYREIESLKCKNSSEQTKPRQD